MQHREALLVSQESALGSGTRSQRMGCVQGHVCSRDCLVRRKTSRPTKSSGLSVVRGSPSTKYLRSLLWCRKLADGIPDLCGDQILLDDTVETDLCAPPDPPRRHGRDGRLHTLHPRHNIHSGGVGQGTRSVGSLSSRNEIFLKSAGRSVTIVAVYLMYTEKIDTEAALDIIRQARPNIEYVYLTVNHLCVAKHCSPNPGFLQQLEIFHKAAFKISRKDQTTRRFYMERTVGEVMNGDGSLPETEMFAKYPRTPSDSAPATPGARRRIRCKMCRQELATREHMLDHGQLGAPTPAASTPVASRHPSMSMASRPRLGSLGAALRPRRPSGLAEGLSMSALETNDLPSEKAPAAGDSDDPNGVRRSISDGPHRPRLRPLISGVADLTMSALNTDEDAEDSATPPTATAGTAARHTRLRGCDAPRAPPVGHPPDANSTDSATTHFSSLGGSDVAVQLLNNPKRGVFIVQETAIPDQPRIHGPVRLYITEQGAAPASKSEASLALASWPLLSSTAPPSAPRAVARACSMRCGCRVTPGFCINRSKVDNKMCARKHPGIRFKFSGVLDKVREGTGVILLKFAACARETMLAPRRMVI
ncbi:hypothetical protein K438DRAFT_1789705 [Mycena galopus ATCC 62051]|nr:hypothetical protein K438DRAFT_1789705 [Mycena galopus ATCC 62051]